MHERKEANPVKHDRATDEIQAQAALFALGSLTQHEARAFEAHLAEGCSVCQRELRRQEELVASLALAAPAAEPSPYVRDILLARIEREEQQPGARPARAAESFEPRPVLPHPRPQPQPRSTVLPWAIAAAVALTAAASYFYTRQQAEQQIQVERTRAEDARSELQQRRAVLEAENRRARQQLDELKAGLGSPGVRFIPLKGQKGIPDASAQVYWDTTNGRWIVAASLPPAPAGKVYQLWFVLAAPGAPVSAGLIPTDSAGRGIASMPLPSGLRKVAAAAITLEPEGGSAAPTMPIYAVGPIS
jgi:anti-sigma-K factor RskA